MEENNRPKNTREILFTEIARGVAIVVATTAIVFFVVTPDAEIKSNIKLMQQDIGFIKENHLEHIQDCLEQQEEWNKEMDNRMDSLDNNITKILTILGE